MHKSINGKIIEMTAEEITALEQDRVNVNNEMKTINDAIEQKKQDAISGNQKLLDLGLTQAEATALTGYIPN